jgi:ribosomal protein L17
MGKKNATSFQRGNKFGIGSRGQLRKDLTIELIRQLNEIDPNDPKRSKMQRVVDNLIDHAMHDRDLRAVKEIFNRVEGKPAKRVPR